MSAALFLATLLAYLLGSLPAGVLYSRLRRQDIRGRDLPGGSGSWRQYGPAVGIGVALLDALRGTLAVALALWLNAGGGDAAEAGNATDWAAALATFAVVLGHCYPVFFGFRGGGGIATLIGALALAAPQALAGAALTAVVAMPVYKFGLQRLVGFNVIPAVTLAAVPVAAYLAWQRGGLLATVLGSAAMAARAVHLLWLMRTGRGAGQHAAAKGTDA